MTLPGLTSLTAVLLASELALALSKRRVGGRGPDRDRLTLPLLWLVIGLSIWAAFELRARVPAGQLPFRLPFYLVGLFLFVAGLVVRWAAIIYLGRFFTVNVSIAEDHRLITTGPYRYVRHPSYSGSLLIFLGLGLCTLNFYALVAIFLPICAAFLWRIRVEEQALRAAFGDRYKSYAAKTRRIIPWVY